MQGKKRRPGSTKGGLAGTEQLLDGAVEIMFEIFLVLFFLIEKEKDGSDRSSNEAAESDDSD